MTQAEIRDPSLADDGRARIEWAWSEMPVLRRIEARFREERPLEGLRVGMCLHVTTETANLARTLAAGGASVSLCASNPLSTRDDVAAALVSHHEIPVFATYGVDTTGYYRHIDRVVASGPQITLDDGADLVSQLHREHPDRLADVVGGTEETTTGVTRLRAMAADGALKYPIVAINDAMTKHFFDNRYGTGQSTIDGILRATNILLAGRTFTVVGYGWCGRGIAMRARGHGAHVVVVEVDPVRALEATMDGYEVMPLLDAAPRSDFVVTATGDKHVVGGAAFEVAKDGCIFANAGHFDVELDLPALDAITERTRAPRPSVVEHALKDGRRLRVLSEGRLVNLAAAEGHPSAVMDMSFANQALAVEHLHRHGRTLAPGVHPVPEAIDRRVARLKLDALGIAIDTLTEEQERYLRSWREGT
ncbi:MAG TPA: adenosylhomocysteinase [Sandaracinaceae bacterium LLY-WYZ-13_1]|nr:adenosylhomocysteinase [Sandaracinaceae bacterium LLY-WYZ-13_1]